MVGGALVSVQPVHGRPDHGDVPVSDRLGPVARVRRHAGDQFRAWLVLYAWGLLGLAGGAVGAPVERRVLGGGAVCRGWRGHLGRRGRTAVFSFSLRSRRALSAFVHLRAGADPGRRRQIHLGHWSALGFDAPGARRQRADLWHHTADLQPVHNRDRPGDRIRRMAGAEPHRRRPDGASGPDGPRDARCARRQCRVPLHRHVCDQRVSRRSQRCADYPHPKHRAGDGRVDHRPGLYRRGDRRPGVAVGHILGIGDLRSGFVFRNSDLSRVLAVFGLRADGGDPDRPALGSIRPPPTMTRRRSAFARRIPWTLIVFLAAATVPWLGSRYDTFLAAQIVIDALFAVSLNLLLGTTGLVSFGHVAYFGVGAYVCGILMKTYGMPFIVAFPAAGIGAAGFALVSGYFCVRLTKLYFAMLTLAFSQIVWAICYKWNAVTGGDQGLPEIPYPNLDWMTAVPGLGDLSIGARFYLLTLALVAVSLAALHQIVRSPFGRMLTTIRDNPERAAFIGLNVRAYQLAAFVVAGTFAGLAGALYGIFSRGVFADYVFWSKSAEVIIMTILGGMDYFWGPPVGALALVWLNQEITDYTEYWPFVLGTLLVVLLYVFPGGIVGGLVAGFHLVRRRLIPGDA